MMSTNLMNRFTSLIMIPANKPPEDVSVEARTNALAVTAPVHMRAATVVVV